MCMERCVARFVCSSHRILCSCKCKRLKTDDLNHMPSLCLDSAEGQVTVQIPGVVSEHKSSYNYLAGCASRHGQLLRFLAFLQV